MNGRMMIGMRVGFQQPDTGIPCVGEYDDEGETLIFDFENYDEAEKHNTKEEIELVRQWNFQNAINCYSEDQANRHLAWLGIKERLED